MSAKVNGLERDAYIEKYKKDKPEVLARRLFDRNVENQELRKQLLANKGSIPEAKKVVEVNNKLKELFESYGYKPTRYIVSYIGRSCASPYSCDEYDCDNCPDYCEDKCVGTFGFYDFNISGGELDAIDAYFNAVNLEVTQVKEEKTGKVIWKKGRK